MSQNQQLYITLNETENRIQAEIENLVAFVAYEIKDDTINYYYVKVPSQFEGRGYGSQLTYFAMEYAKEHGYTVNPQCPFVRHYVSKHSEYHDITLGFNA